MGVIQSQSFKNTIFGYLGLAIGYVNFVLLYPNFFKAEEFGLLQLLMAVSLVYSQISFFGLYTTITKYFPILKSEDKRHNGFLLIVFVISGSAFLLITLAYLLFKPIIVNAFATNSALFLDYYFILLPLSLSLLLFNIFEGLARSIFKTVYSVFLKEFLLRLLTTVLIVGYIFEIFGFDEFLVYFIILNGVIAILMLLSVIRSNEFAFKGFFVKVSKSNWRNIIRFSSYSFLGGSTYMLAENIDKIMIGSYVGLSMVGIYSVFFYVAGVLRFPARALYRISFPVIADSWKRNDSNSIKDVYYRSSRLLHITGSIILIGLLINLNNILYFFNKPEYGANIMILVILGFAALIDVTGGINSDIIATSPKFKFDALFNILYLVVCIALNVILIPTYGVLGAAFATFASMLLFNIVKWNYIRKVFSMQPFDLKYLFIILISIISFTVGYIIPELGNVIVDIILRSVIATFVFFTPIIYFKLDPDILRIFNKYYSKIFRTS